VLAARPILLLITDYHLTDMCGDELASAVKAASPATRVLLITADVELDAQAGWEHVDHCLIKPLRMFPACCQERLAQRQTHTKLLDGRVE
jgi:response regulator RpfG family c-di-GMP phosphodiesterase